VGISGQNAHYRLKKLGLAKPMNVWTLEEEDMLLAEYANHADWGRLDELAARLGRHKTVVCTRARLLGLTNQRRRKYGSAVWKYMPEAEARLIFDDFKATRYTLKDHCALRGYDELGFWRTLSGYFPDEWDAVIESKAPIASMYRRGRTFEYRVRNILRAAGYYVMRSPRSGSPIDLVAICSGTVLMVQCKLGGLNRPEWNEVFDLATSAGAIPIYATRPVPRKCALFRLLGRKDGSRRRQPMEVFTP